MTTVQFVGDLIERNGLTVKQNNLAIPHSIPLGTLVEIIPDEWDDEEECYSGSRVYVVGHSRDCDGTPLYNLSADKNAAKKYEACIREFEQACGFNDPILRLVTHLNKERAAGAIMFNWHESGFKVVA